MSLSQHDPKHPKQPNSSMLIKEQPEALQNLGIPSKIVQDLQNDSDVNQDEEAEYEYIYEEEEEEEVPGEQYNPKDRASEQTDQFGDYIKGLSGQQKVFSDQSEKNSKWKTHTNIKIIK